MMNDNIQAIDLDSIDKKEPKYYSGKIFRNTRGMSLRWRISNFFEDIKKAWHRAKNGYCHCDSWDIQDWFLETMPHILDDMINHLHGYPGYGDASTFENWKAILQHMQYCFVEANENTCSQKNEWEDSYEFITEMKELEDGRTQWICEAVPEENWEKYKEREKEIYKYRQDRLQEGLELFNKWYFQLWD